MAFEDMDSTAMEDILMMAPEPVEPKFILASCPDCAEKSRQGSLKRYHVNLEESIVLCDNDLCCYMSEKPPVALTEERGKCLEIDNDLQILNDIISPQIDVISNIDDLPINDSLNEFMNTLLDTDSKNSTPERPEVCSDISSCASSLVQGATPDFRASIEDTDLQIHSKDRYKYPYTMLWANIDALCWLDVLLCVLCHNTSIRETSTHLPYTSVLKKLLVAFDEAQALIAPLQNGGNRLLHTVMDQERLSVKRGECTVTSRLLRCWSDLHSSTGGGYTQSLNLNRESFSVTPDSVSDKDVCMAKRKIHLANIKLECVREEIWQVIEPLLNCKRGTDDSPVFAFPLILRTDETINSLYQTSYTWVTECKVCHHKDSIRGKKPMISFPKVTTEFVMYSNMMHRRACVTCNAPDQTRTLKLNSSAPNFSMHFAEGLASSDIDRLAFTTEDGSKYAVSAVIEYKTSPNHFAIWQREHPLDKPGKWMVYDDLQSQYSQFCTSVFSAPSNNIHIVFWERLSSGKPKPTFHNEQRQPPSVAKFKKPSPRVTPAACTQPLRKPVSVPKTSVPHSHRSNQDKPVEVGGSIVDVLLQDHSPYNTPTNSLPPYVGTTPGLVKDTKPSKTRKRPHPVIERSEVTLPSLRKDTPSTHTITVTRQPRVRSKTVPEKRQKLSSATMSKDRKSPDVVPATNTISAVSTSVLSPQISATSTSVPQPQQVQLSGVSRPTQRKQLKLLSTPVIRTQQSSNLRTAAPRSSLLDDAPSVSRYTDIMKTINRHSVDPSNQSLSGKRNYASLDSNRSMPSAHVTTKSYLDVVQPLLHKSKMQKGTALCGYVSRNKRKASRSPSPRKKVQFTAPDVPVKASPKRKKNDKKKADTPAAVSNLSAILSSPTHSDAASLRQTEPSAAPSHCDTFVTSIIPDPVPIINQNNNAFILEQTDEISFPNPLADPAFWRNDAHSESQDMPSLDDMLDFNM